MGAVDVSAEIWSPRTPHPLRFPQEELDQWSAVAQQKEEDSLAMERYRRQDEARVKELSSQACYYLSPRLIASVAGWADMQSHWLESVPLDRALQGRQKGRLRPSVACSRQGRVLRSLARPLLALCSWSARRGRCSSASGTWTTRSRPPRSVCGRSVTSGWGSERRCMRAPACFWSGCLALKIRLCELGGMHHFMHIQGWPVPTCPPKPPPQAAQTELNKAAEDFRALHAERQELLAQWEGVLAAVAARDEAILAAGKEFAERKAALAQLKAALDAEAAELQRAEEAGGWGGKGSGSVGWVRRWHFGGRHQLWQA